MGLALTWFKTADSQNLLQHHAESFVHSSLTLQDAHETETGLGESHKMYKTAMSRKSSLLYNKKIIYLTLTPSYRGKRLEMHYSSAAL